MDEHVEERKILKTIEAAGDVSVRRSAVGVVHARAAHFTQSIVGPVSASGEVSFVNAGCGPLYAGGDVSFTNGGCGPIVTRGDVSFRNGGTQSVIAAGGATIGSGGIVGLVAAPSVTVEDGGRVLMSTQQAAAFGAAFAVVLGLVTRLVRRR